MSTLAEIEIELQHLAPEKAAHFERLFREMLELVRDSAAAPSQARGERAVFPIIQGTPGVVINPTKEQLHDF
jgi:hypothetical protein